MDRAHLPFVFKTVPGRDSSLACLGLRGTELLSFCDFGAILRLSSQHFRSVPVPTALVTAPPPTMVRGLPGARPVPPECLLPRPATPGDVTDRVLGEPHPQDSFVTVETDSHFAKPDERFPAVEPKSGRTNAGVDMLPSFTRVPSRERPGPRWHTEKARKDAGMQCQPGPPPGESGVWSQVGHLSDITWTPQLEEVWIVPK